MLIELVLSRSRLGQVQPGNTNRKESNRTEETKREQRTEQGYRFLAGYYRVASNGNCNGNGSAVRYFVMWLNSKLTALQVAPPATPATLATTTTTTTSTNLATFTRKEQQAQHQLWYVNSPWDAGGLRGYATLQIVCSFLSLCVRIFKVSDINLSQEWAMTLNGILVPNSVSICISVAVAVTVPVPSPQSLHSPHRLPLWRSVDSIVALLSVNVKCLLVT